MLISTASFLPIIIVGPIADLASTTAVVLVVAIAITISGILSAVLPAAARTGPGMTRVAVVFTGGTISMVVDPLAGGAVPALDGAAILARTPGLDEIAEVMPSTTG